VALCSAVIILVKAGSAVDDTIAGLAEHMEAGDTIIDGGNEWYENTERREKALAAKGILYLGMGVSGGEEGARNGPSMMPGGSREAYARIEDVVTKVAAQVDGGACVTYIGPGGAGNFVKMVHNGIEYGDMQLISEAYDMLRTVGGLSNKELADAFAEWNAGDLSSFLVEITAQIFGAWRQHVAPMRAALACAPMHNPQLTRPACAAQRVRTTRSRAAARWWTRSRTKRA